MIDFLGVSFQSTILFVLIGILIGHLLWYHDRSADSQKIDGLENRYFKACGTVGKRKREFVKLQKDSEQQRGELQIIRQQQAALLKQKSDLQQESRAAHAEIERLRGDKQQLDAKLTAEQARSELVVAQLQEVLRERSHSASELESQSNSLDTLHASHDQLQAELQTHTNTIDLLRQANAGLESQVHKLTDTLEAHQSHSSRSAEQDHETIVNLEREIQVLRESAKRTSEVLNQTRQDLVARCEDLDTIRDQRDTAVRQLTVVTQRLTEIERQMAEANSIASQHVDLVKDLELAASSLGEQRELLSIRELELAEIKAEMVDTKQALNQLQTQSASYRSEIEKHSVDNQLLQTELEQLQQQLQQTTVELDQLQSLTGQLTSTSEDQKAELIRLQAEVGELESVREQAEEISKEFVTAANQRDELDRIRVQVESRAAELEKQLAAQTARVSEVSELLNARTQEYSETIASMKQQSQAKAEQMQELTLQLGAMTDQYQLQLSSVEMLTAKVLDAEKLRPQNQELNTQVADLVDHLKRLRAELEDSLDTNEKSQDRVRYLETQLHEQTVKIRQLRSDRGSIIGIAAEGVSDRQAA